MVNQQDNVKYDNSMHQMRLYNLQLFNFSALDAFIQLAAT
jgi:hypothetical protein